MEFVLLESFSNYIDAHILMGRLEQEGIRCWLKDENTVTIDPILSNAVGGIKLMVPRPQLERAAELLQQFRLEKRNLFACPYCGSHEIELVTTPRKAMNWLAAITTWLMGDYAMATEQAWHCFNCSKEFKEPVETKKQEEGE